MHQEQETIKKIFDLVKTIAFVGLSPKKEKTSNRIGRYLIKKGYRLYPVYPEYSGEILGQKTYDSLSKIPDKIDMVLLFLNSSKIMQFTEDVISVKPKAVWLPEGVLSEGMKRLSERENILFVMDKCIYKEHIKYLNL